MIEINLKVTDSRYKKIERAILAELRRQKAVIIFDKRAGDWRMIEARPA